MLLRLIVLLFCIQQLSAQKIYVFGDSLSDTGNAGTVAGQAVPTAPYYMERASNGPLWIDHLTIELGDPDGGKARIRGGRNYSVAGSKTNDLFLPQFALAIQNLGGIFDFFDSQDLFIIWIGGNDLLNGVGEAPSDMLDRIQNAVTSLQIKGARRFLFCNLPNLSTLPEEIGKPNAAALEQSVLLYNSLLANYVTTIDASPLFTAQLLDVFSVVTTITNNPRAYGFRNATQSAYDRRNKIQQPEANTFLYWDDRHPTARAHRMIAQLALHKLQNRQTIIPLHAGHSDGTFRASWIIPNAASSIAVESSSTLATPWTREPTISSPISPVLDISRSANAPRNFYRIVQP